MLVTNGPRWLDRRRPESSGPSIVVSVLLTAALFASAFSAMRTVGVFTPGPEPISEPPVMVRLAPPPIAQSEPVARPQPARRTNEAPATTPNDIAPATAAPAPAVTAAEPQASQPRDTARAASDAAPRQPTIGPGVPTLPSTLGQTPMGRRGGAPTAPSGVTIGSRTANTERYRDSVINLRLKTGVGTWMDHLPTGRELAELQASQRAARQLATRATTAGSKDVHIVQGEGMNGEGAVGGASPGFGTISAPLLSSGPSAAQRKKNEAVDSDYQLRLRRLQDRLALRRDSIRADSLRRDSLARARRP